MNKWGIASLLLLLSLISVDSFAGTSTTPLGVSDPVDAHLDLSVSFLSQLFGTVGNVLQGTSGQMIGKLLGELNTCLLSVAGIWVCGTVLMGAIRVGTQGSFLGQNHNVPLIFLRMTLMVACLIPSSTGYSLLQDVLMKVVVEGVKVADSVWKYGLDYISDGGQLWIMPTASTGNSDQLLTADAMTAVLGRLYDKNNPDSSGVPVTNPGPGLGLAQRIFSSEVCMVTSSMEQQQKTILNSQSAGSTNITASTTSMAPAYNWIEDDNNNAVFFPGDGNDPNTSASTDPTQQEACGYVTWDIMGGATSPGSSSLACHARGASDGSSGAWCQYAQLAILDMVGELQQAATEFACTEGASNNPAAPVCNSVNGMQQSQVHHDMETALFNAVVDYSNSITPLVNANSQNMSSAAYSFIQTAENQGWISAGRFYWDLAHVESSVQEAGNLQNYTPHVVSPSAAFNANTDVLSSMESGDGEMDKNSLAYQSSTVVQNAEKQLMTSFNTDDSYQNSQQSGDTNTATTVYGITNIVNAQIGDYSSTSSIGDVSGDNGNDSIDFGHRILNALLPIVGDINKLISSFDNSHIESDPILWLHDVGTICINIAGDIWFAPLGSMFGIAMCFIICNSEVNPIVPVQMILSWLKPFFMSLAVAFFGCGAILAIYIPLYPFEVFTLSSLSWMMMVLEIMVAAPIIALGIGNSQGHDILGRAETAVWMVFSAFIGPTTRVVGLCSGMILSYVGLKMLVWGFSGISYDLFKSSFSGDFGNGNVLTAAREAKHTMEMSGATAQDVGYNMAAGATIGSAAAGPVGAVFGAVGGLTPMLATALTRLLVLPLFLMVFTYMVYLMTTQCYNIIYSLGNVIKYVGSHAEHGAVDQMMNQMKDGLSSGANTGGGAMTKGSSGAMGVKPSKEQGGEGVSTDAASSAAIAAAG